MGLGLTYHIPAIVYVAGFIVVFLTIFYRVEIGMFYLIPLIPMQNIIIKMQDYPLGKDLVDILFMAIIVGWTLRKKERFMEKNQVNWAVFFLLSVSFIGLFMGSVGNPFSLENGYFITWKNFMLMPILFLIVANNIKDERDMKILMFIMALSFFMLFYNFHNAFEATKTYHFTNRERIGSMAYYGPNEMASFAGQGAMIFLSIWLMYRHRWSRIVLGAVIFANLYVVVYSYSRAAYLAVFASLLFLGIAKERKILIALMILAAFWTSFLPKSVVERIRMTQSVEGELDGSSAQRFEIWERGVQSFYENPLGVGFNRFQSLRVVEEDGKGKDAHNMFLKMLVELGVQGLFIYTYLYIIALRIGWQLYREADNEFLRGLGMGFVLCTICNMVNNFFGQSWMFFPVNSFYWVFMALVIRARMIVQERGMGLQPAVAAQAIVGGSSSIAWGRATPESGK